ncbi:transcriptional regulator [Aeromicrobium sp. Root344]|uniref:TetR family transcriptional regulator n=1 Tax=Aeromicrobium sp. Root344 TaxID=1736521 RepID=UPI00070102DD|nr:TetR family transcriptional regulator [Aeromicrobium sp. Root344]KQV76943.1 transcriptional regulator [Aeromicrobium sp. Root344]
MSTPYEAGGRVEQKSRTRSALVAAAREMVARGLAPSVAEAADAAAISRTTAYRYFRNQRSLLAAAHPETGAESMLDDEALTDPAERLDAVMRRFTSVVLDTEAQQRTMLRLSLEEDPADRGSQPLRQGRAIGWITEALEPLRDQLSEDELHRLVLAIRSATGIEALVWLTDIGGMSREDAVTLMRWSAQSMLQAALGVSARTG